MFHQTEGPEQANDCAIKVLPELCDEWSLIFIIFTLQSYYDYVIYYTIVEWESSKENVKSDRCCVSNLVIVAIYDIIV